jgi:hypothetical protein
MSEKKVLFVHRTACFDRKLGALRRKGGTASIAADKAEAVICQIIGMKERDLRKKFRFTRHGEYRIKYCGKYDLSCGYRLVFIRRNSHIAFIYAGSHDECSRWIERNQGLTYKIDDTAYALQITEASSAKNNFIPHDEVEEDDQSGDEYEAQLMRKIDDKTLRMLFSGFAKIQITPGG